METNQNLETVLPMLKWAISQNLYCDINAGYDGRIEFSCQAKSYKNVHDFVRLFKTNLIKSQSGTGGCLDYTFINEEMTIKLYAIYELPPSCSVVYSEVFIPAKEARIERISTVVCN